MRDSYQLTSWGAYNGANFHYFLEEIGLYGQTFLRVCHIFVHSIYFSVLGVKLLYVSTAFYSVVDPYCSLIYRLRTMINQIEIAPASVLSDVGISSYGVGWWW